MSENTRTVEVIRVGTIGLDKDYPGKQVVRLRDLTALYEGGALAGTKGVEFFLKKYRSGTQYEVPFYEGPTPWEVAANPSLLNQVKHGTRIQEVVGDPGWTALAVPALNKKVDDLYERLKGKRLAGINVNVWDQISGAYLGSRNTDKHGTLVLPTDEKFVEVLQWQLAGGGYSDCFNGERAAGTPGLAFYFPCNEGAGASIASFPGVSGQQASLPSSWEWYDTGFFNRPALKRVTGTDALEFMGADPQGRRSFQFLWYCEDPRLNYTLFSYGYPIVGTAAYPAFSVKLSGGVLYTMAGSAQSAGSTSIESGKWYLVQVNTQGVLKKISDPSPPPGLQPIYDFTTTLYLNAGFEATANSEVVLSTLGPVCKFACSPGDGLDEIRHLNRELYMNEIAEYAAFLKNGRYPGMSNGKLGEPGW